MMDGRGRSEILLTKRTGWKQVTSRSDVLESNQLRDNPSTNTQKCNLTKFEGNKMELRKYVALCVVGIEAKTD